MEIFSLQKVKMEQGCDTLPVRFSQPAVNEAISCLLENVADHMYSKEALQKSKVFLKNKIINFEIDSVKQVYPTRPVIPNQFQQQHSPRIALSQCMRPMSAQIRQYTRSNQRSTIITPQSKKTIQSFGSLASYNRVKRNTTSMKSVLESTKKKRKFNKSQNCNQKRFFAVKSTYDDNQVNANFIEELRLKKQQEQNQAKKKEEFLKSIQLQSASYSTAQSKFVQSIIRKKFIYGHQGQIIEINGNSQKSHLKKISAMSKSRIQIKPKSTVQLKKFQQELKQNIYIEFKGRDTHQTRPQTGKPSQSEKIDEMKGKFFSVKETKRHPEEGLKKILDNLNERKKTGTERQKQMKGGVQNDKVLIKKKMQKILFYQSANSVYRVINDMSTPSQNINDRLSIKNL